MGEEGRIVCGHRLVGRGLASDRRAWVVRGLVSERSQMLRDDVLFRPFSLFVFNLLAAIFLFIRAEVTGMSAILIVAN